MQVRISIPPLTRLLLALLLAISATHQASRYIFHALPSELLALVPQQSVFYPWVYVTAAFAEQNLITFLIAAATILYGGKYLERAWGAAEFGRFFLLVTVIPNVAASIVYILWFAITRDSARALTYIQGSVALQGAFLVAFKQLVPEHLVTILKGVIKIRVKHFPAIFLAANTISGFVIGTDTGLVLAWTGFFTSWLYLRFYKKQTDLSSTTTSTSRIRGDASETFAFAYFWPDAIHGPVAAVADVVYNALVTARILAPFSAEDVETSNVQASARGEAGLPSLLNQGGRRGGKREEAERRRALALKVLDQRLQAATTNKQQSSSPTESVPRGEAAIPSEAEAAGANDKV
ncbi:uncharacterized protein KY384_004338 [Bacidia gigantensis]|uniref:uncharacterized protein n=1 Tax=Bacidia gigantensis TaxID=2732470 RepID=UPI001D048460|nr:uncharacterized protein KY384_004338 [Bacidia gigantensis]KAG8530981.1 hypothetical protein KY384_004338 [Bacidia gigantensis]